MKEATEEVQEGIGIKEESQSIPDIAPSSEFPAPTEDIQNVVTGDSGVGGKSKMIMVVGVVIFVVAIVSAAAYYFLVMNKEVDDGGAAEQEKVVPTRAPVNNSSGFKIDERATYSDSSKAITFRYPNDVTVVESPDGEIIISKSGPTQKEGTELYDGISVTIIPSELGDSSLKEIVDAKFATFMASSVAPVDGDIEIFTANSTSGYTFTVDGVVKYDYIYLPLGLDYYVQIIDSTIDPEGEGFQAVVDNIIDSIEFLPPATSE